MDKSERIIYPGQIFRHFKGKLYQIVTVAVHSETGERMVIYQQLYGQYKVYARPYDMFVSEVDHEKYPNVSQRYRFESVTLDEQGELPGQPDISVQSQEKLPVQKQQVCGAGQSDKEMNVRKAAVSSGQKSAGAEQVNEGVNPLLLLFLDAETYEEKRNVLMNIKGEITDRLIDDIAVSMDVAVDKGELNERFASLLSCIDMMAKFEVDRLR